MGKKKNTIRAKETPIEEKEEKEKKKRRFAFFWLWFLKPKNKTPILASAIGVTMLLSVVGIVSVVRPRPSSSSLVTSSPTTPTSSSVSSNITYTVQFNALGGSDVPSQTVVANALINEPTSIKTGFVLTGWYQSNDNGVTLQTMWNFTNNQVTSNLTLFAGWDVEQFTITFDTNGGTDIVAITGVPGTAVTLPANPTKIGHMFIGWFSDEDLTTSATVVTEISDRSITYYAGWSVNTYTVTYMSIDNVPMQSVKADVDATIALSQDGRLYGWGINSGKFLNASPFFTSTPTLIPVVLPDNQVITDFTFGGGGVFALTDARKVYVWGGNNFGNLGLGDKATPKPISELILPNLEANEFISKVSSNGVHTMFLTNLFNVYMVGGNSFGQLGDGTKTEQLIPFKLSFALNNDEHISDVYTGVGSSYVVTSQSRMFAWGINSDGRLGTGGTLERLVPTLVQLPVLQQNETITKVFTYDSHVGLLTSAARVMFWGANGFGQLGLGNNSNVLVPTVLDTSFLASGETIKLISMGGRFNVIISSLNRLFTSGSNLDNGAGTGVAGSTNVFTEIFLANYDNSDDIISIASGVTHTNLVTQHGRVYGWGKNTIGQLGDRTTEARPTGIRIIIGEIDKLKDETIPFATSIPVYSPTQDGSTFEGWYRDIELNVPFADTLMPATNLILYAKWTTIE